MGDPRAKRNTVARPLRCVPAIVSFLNPQIGYRPEERGSRVMGLPERSRVLADELRSKLIDAVSVTGSHSGAGLGVVELTVALHYVFDTPHKRLVWFRGRPSTRSGRRGGPTSRFSVENRSTSAQTSFQSGQEPDHRGNYVTLTVPA